MKKLGPFNSYACDSFFCTLFLNRKLNENEKLPTWLKNHKMRTSLIVLLILGGSQGLLFIKKNCLSAAPRPSPCSQLDIYPQKKGLWKKLLFKVLIYAKYLCILIFTALTPLHSINKKDNIFRNKETVFCYFLHTFSSVLQDILP